MSWLKEITNRCSEKAKNWPKWKREAIAPSEISREDAIKIIVNMAENFVELEFAWGPKGVGAFEEKRLLKAKNALFKTVHSARSTS